MGLRGIINDRNDKYLLLVNGRNMNQHTHFEALSEQDLVLLSDIHHIDIVRGPGSALYGTGAISMVINIVTFNANTFQGTEITSCAGAIEGFATGELKYGKKFEDKNLDLAASIYLHKLAVISWDNSAQQALLVGTQNDGGIEIEASYHTQKIRLTVCHGYTRLFDFDLKPGRTSYLTSEPYGHDLTNWSNNITKLVYQRKLDEKWTLNGSLRVYWGFPGLKDYEENYSTSLVEDGWKRTYRGSYFLDLGLQYKPNKRLSLAVNGYNLLGCFDKDLNKRNYIETSGAAGSDFRNHAPAASFSLNYAF